MNTAVTATTTARGIIPVTEAVAVAPEVGTLALGTFVVDVPPDVLDAPTPDWLRGWLQADAEAPVARSEAVRKDVRDMLRFGGYKPTGRGKPASEYLLGAAASGRLTSINPLVDAGNAVSLHSGLPVSIVDLDRTEGTLRVEVAEAGSTYVFNAAGQVIDVGGLLCLHDEDGPCANGVKDSQRTKTHPGTHRALALVWGCRLHGEQSVSATVWFRELLEAAGCRTAPLEGAIS